MIAMETRPAPTAITTTGMTAEQWPQVEVIYRAGIATGYATFEAEPPSWDDFDRTRLADHRLVANDSTGRILGWVAAGKSDWTIGRILNISGKTVNFHVENAKRKLGAGTRIQAVVTAMRNGLIA